MHLIDLDVIDINEDLMYFKCKKNDTTMIINAGISCSYYGTRLPQVGTKFDLDKFTYHYHEEYVNDECIISLCHKKYPRNPSNFQSEDNLSNLSRIIKKFKLGWGDLVVVTKMYESAKGTVPSQVNLSQFILTS